MMSRRKQLNPKPLNKGKREKCLQTSVINLRLKHTVFNVIAK